MLTKPVVVLPYDKVEHEAGEILSQWGCTYLWCAAIVLCFINTCSDVKVSRGKLLTVSYQKLELWRNTDSFCLFIQVVLSGRCSAKVRIRLRSVSRRRISVTATMIVEITGTNNHVEVRCFTNWSTHWFITAVKLLCSCLCLFVCLSVRLSEKS